MRLLIVEDNARLAALMAERLGQRGFVCDQAGCLDEAGAAMAVAQYDALVLDLGLPDGNGLSWLRGLRARGDMTPALILTARGELDDRISGLDAGADDYVVKPAEADEIAARIRALLRRPGPRASPVLVSGALRLDPATRQAHHAGVPVELSRRETDLLELLMRHAGKVVRRDMIDEALYSFNDTVSPNAIEASVSRLRRRLAEAGAGDMLHTIRGLGYMLKDTQP